MLNTYTFIHERWEAQYSCYIRIHEKAHAHTRTCLVWCAKFRAAICMSKWNVKKLLRRSQRPMLCAANGKKQRLRIMRMSMKSYYITQVGYVSTRLLCTYMYMYIYIYTYIAGGKSHASATRFVPKLSRWGWVFLERTQILSGIQYTTHFIDFFVVETKRFVGSSVNVILTRQTCGQLSSRAAESKRWALENYFPEWICYMFLMSKCWASSSRDWDLGRCTFWVLAKREKLRNAKFRFFLRAKHVFFRKSLLRSGSLFASTQKAHRPRS